MEYIDFDIKRIINDRLHGDINPNSVELDYDIKDLSLSKSYDSLIYLGVEKDGWIEVKAGFSCVDTGDNERKGCFSAYYYIDQKYFRDDFSCQIELFPY